ncbi:MAG TPA: CBS domain-containing protein [Gemmatimonadales bacterium]|jgi:CBS domain-containing protein|nr:CBS domain-containing protein [Gemmatimonadales bacterium]
MTTVRDILARKGPTVVTVEPHSSVLEAAQLMNSRGIGAVLVTREGKLEGIFTERDVMRRVVAGQLDPATTPVCDVMSTALVVTTQEAPIRECAALMTSRRIRHLPVMSADALIGVITTGDLMAFEVAEQAVTIAQLSSYVYDTR